MRITTRYCSVVGIVMIMISLILTPCIAEATLMDAVDAGYDVVSMGGNGSLVYTQDSFGNKVPDFSFAGYKGGGVAIPDVPAVITLTPCPGDNKANIQNAINTVSAMTLDANGFRGAVQLSAGVFDINSTPGIVINASGVVLRGQGVGLNGTILRMNTTGGYTVSIAGLVDWTRDSTIYNIVGSYYPVGANQLTVNSVTGLSVGNAIRLSRARTAQWCDTVGMSSWINDSYMDFLWYRKITAIDTVNKVITIDRPIMNSIGDYGTTASFQKITKDTRVNNIGVEDITFISNYDRTLRVSGGSNDGNYIDDAHAENAVKFERNYTNCWVRRCAAFFYRTAVFSLKAANNIYCNDFVTIQDCAVIDPVSANNQGNAYGGARAYNFDICSKTSLVQRSYSRGGRHDFVMNGPIEGSVFLDCLARYVSLVIEPHQRWTHGALYDNVQGDQPFLYKYEPDVSNAHGQRAANSMYWNCNSVIATNDGWTTADYSPSRSQFIVDMPLYVAGDKITGQNWCIGCSAVNFNSTLGQLGYFRSMNAAIANPRSLYLQQLKERLGASAVNQVITAEQATSAQAVRDSLDSKYSSIPRFGDPQDLGAWLPAKIEYNERTIAERLDLNTITINKVTIYTNKNKEVNFVNDVEDILNVDISIGNNRAQDYTLSLIIACYQDGNLKGISLKGFYVPGWATDFKLNNFLGMLPENKNDVQLKIFVWKSVQSLTPFYVKNIPKT